MAVDLSDLMEPTLPRKPRTKRAKVTETEAGSIAQVVDKVVLLSWVEQLEVQPTAAIAVAHKESVSEWTGTISAWLREQEREEGVSWTQLQQEVALSWSELWLGLLLGGFRVEQRGEFYSQALWVKLPQVEER